MIYVYFFAKNGQSKAVDIGHIHLLGVNLVEVD